jgi:AcrR family transcriptional regulator
MEGHRERKKRATRAAIHHAALRLFAEHGFTATTVDRIADEAGVSRATVFSYFPTKEDIVFGDAPSAVAALREALQDEGPALETVRAWLGRLAGWIEPELAQQLRLIREVPAVAAKRLQIGRALEDAVAQALERELGPEQRLSARLAAASLAAALGVAEEAAVGRMEADGRALSDEEIGSLLDDAVAFAEAGVAATAARRTG